MYSEIFGVPVSIIVWQKCLSQLQEELTATEFNLWIRPLQVENEDDKFYLYAPNRFVQDWVKNKYLAKISLLLSQLLDIEFPRISIQVGSPEHSNDSVLKIVPATEQEPTPAASEPKWKTKKINASFPIL